MHAIVVEGRPKSSQTGTSKRRSTSLRDVLHSVLGVRSPMMRAHGTLYVPVGNTLARVPWMTTARGGTSR
jgi:hypothetical protein